MKAGFAAGVLAMLLCAEVFAVDPRAAPAPQAAADPVASLVNQGQALFKAQRYDEALAAYNLALELKPHNASLWAIRGFAYANMQPPNLPAARHDFDKAIGIDPNQSTAYFNRAILSRMAGQEAAFQADMRKAAELGNPGAQQILQREAAAQSAAARNPNPPPQARNASARNSPAEAAAPGGNAVEPLSNGLSMRWDRDTVKKKFGAPKAGWISCEMDYGSFGVHQCYGPNSMRVFLNSPDIRLASGIGVGSGKAEVARVFGNADQPALGPYKLKFAYNGNRVSAITIDYDAPSRDAGPQTAAAADRDRNNFYMNQQQLQNRLDQNGTIGYNPFRN